jgi:hypothetical protein
MRPLHLLIAALALAPLAPPAHAQIAAKADSGTLIIYDGSMPIANERYLIQTIGDSLVVSATHHRKLLDEQGQQHVFTKNMLLVADSRDLGLLHYNSVQEFQGHTAKRQLQFTDTVLTYFHDVDENGQSDFLGTPPGRLFVLDSQMFTLFDVLCRSLASKQFTSRRVQLLALFPDSLDMPVATITLARPDTLRSGARRTVARHYQLEDANTRYELWADTSGRMLRMTHPMSGLSVELLAEESKPVRPRRRPPARR